MGLKVKDPRSDCTSDCVPFHCSPSVAFGLLSHDQGCFFLTFTLFERSTGEQDLQFQREKQRRSWRYINLGEGLSQVTLPSNERGKSKTSTCRAREKRCPHTRHQMVKMAQGSWAAVAKAEWVRRPCAPRSIGPLKATYWQYLGIIYSFKQYCAFTICKEICNWPAINRVKEFSELSCLPSRTTRKLDKYYFMCPGIKSPVFSSWCSSHQ